MKQNISTFLGCEAEYDEATHVVFGAPFDGTTSYRPGTRFASSVMRNDSRLGFESYSPVLDKDLYDVNIFDAGDLELPYGSAAKVLDSIEAFTDQVLADNKVPVMIGGEHLVSLGAFRSIIKKYKDVYIIHFDAHTDLRDEFGGVPLSHATVLKKMAALAGEKHLFQFGIRSGLKEEFEYAREKQFINLHNFDGLSQVVENLKGKQVYLTIDLDVLDPSTFPGTGTPEPGGVSFKELVNAIYSMKDLNIIGADLVELAPYLDPSGASTSVAIKTLRELLLTIVK